MSKHAAPRHRKAPERSALDAPRKAVRATVLLGGLAAAATGAVVTGGVVAGGDSTLAAASVDAAALTGAAASADTPTAAPSREATVSRSADRRAAADPEKAAALAAVAETKVRAIARTEDASDDDPKTIASALLADYGWDSSQFGCLDSLWTRESNWNPHASNASSGAYGIPQSLPGSKMASVGADWQTNPVTQIKWGLGYIQARYGSPCGAWGHSQGYGWY